MPESTTKGNVSIEELRRINKKIGRRKSGPTPPSPQNPTARFKFFTGPLGKSYGPAVIQKEMQRYAFTPQGNKFFRELQKQQHEKMVKESTKGSEMKILPSNKISAFEGLKNLFGKKGK